MTSKMSQLMGCDESVSLPFIATNERWLKYKGFERGVRVELLIISALRDD